MSRGAPPANNARGTPPAATGRTNESARALLGWSEGMKVSDEKRVDAPLEEDQPTRRERIAEWLARIRFFTYTTLAVILLALSFLWPRIFIVVPAGHRGVMYRSLKGGTITDRLYGEGVRVIPPWDKLTVYETRLQQSSLTFNVLSEEGLDLGVTVSARYRVNQDMLGYLHQDIGPEYFERLVKPEVEAHVRHTFGNRPAHEIHSSARDILQELNRVPVIGRLDSAGSVLNPSEAYVFIQELKVTSITLPKIVESAIAERYHQEQLMLEYRYKLEREEKEADRKRTEAAGIRDYNLIAGTISPDLLRWRSVDAALALAQSDNSKVIVLGGGQNGAPPLMLDIGEGKGGAAPAPAANAAPAAPAAAPANP